MTTAPSIICPGTTPAPGAQAVLRVTVLDDTAQLIVRFAEDVTQTVTSPPSLSPLEQASSYVLTGGERAFPRVLSATVHNPPDTPTALLNHRILLQLDRIGDFSIYTLSVSGREFDPFFTSIRLRFRLGCDAAFDCRPPAEQDEALAETDVAIDYQTKDYASFRQALLDFVPTRLPQWTERSEADIGIMILELFAATADTLSYTQDRIANEAFLETATQRRSVAAHLALIGYELDEGASAATWLKLTLPPNTVQTVAPGLKVSTKKEREADTVIVFETLVPVTVRSEHDELWLFDWEHPVLPPAQPNRQCCVPKGAVTADLAGSLGDLESGAWLLFEDGVYAEVVRIVERPNVIAAQANEIVPTGPRTSVRFTPALRNEYCLPRTRVSANIIPATHGESVGAADSFDVPAGDTPARLRFRLTQGPLAFLDPSSVALTDQAVPAHSASTLMLTVAGDLWTQKSSLLESDANDRVYRLEIDDDGDAIIVFGNGVFGSRPPAGKKKVEAMYRVGGGAAGNIAAGVLGEVHPEWPGWLKAITNPLPATGGRDRESRDHARRFGPATFGDPLMLVTADDYERAAESVTDAAGASLVQRATTTFRWTGSWLTVTTAIDARGDAESSPETIAAVLRVLDARRLAGYDLETAGAAYLPLEVVIGFCASAGYNTADVQKRLEQALASFFDPDNFSFGDSVYVSRLYAAAMAVAGVESVRIARLAMLHAADPDRDTANNLKQGRLEVGSDQVVRLENDRNHPERGTLVVRPMGGHS